MTVPDFGGTAGLFSLCRPEIRKTLGSRRFQGLSVLFVLVMVWASILSLERYRGERAEQARGRDLHRQEIAEISIDRAASVWFPAWKPPWALAFVVDGGQASAPDHYRQQLTAWEAPRLERKLERKPRLPGIPPLDWMFALSSILFLAACLELYDSIVGERLSGLMRLTFSYPLARWRYLAAKLLSGWACLSCPLLLGIGLSLAVSLIGEPGIGTPQNLGKVAGVTLLCLWAAFFFVSLSILASLCARDPANSLIALLILWVSWVIVVPALAAVGARQLVPLPVGAEVVQRSEKISQQVDLESGGRGTGWRKRNIAAGDDFAWERRSAFHQNQRFEEQEKLRREILSAKIRQARKAQDLAAVFSPTSLIQELAVRFTGTGYLRDEAFLLQVRDYREELETRLASLDDLDRSSPHLLFFTGYMSEKPLPAGSFSEFRFREKTIEEGLEASWTGLAGLALETLLLLVLMFRIFARYDPG